MSARGTPAAPRRLLIVEIGASAGRPDALRELISELPADGSITCILVEHLDQTQKRLMVELLAVHTAMPVSQVTKDALIELKYIYVIPPRSCWSVSDDALHRWKPTAPRKARMPVNFLFESMVNRGSNRAIAIILSGTGSDGTLGVRAVHHDSAFVLAQDSVEVEYDDMPQSAVANGSVDVVLTVAKMPAALAGRLHGMDNTAAPKPPASPHNALPRTIGPLRKNTQHDFTLYIIETLQRQIVRRMTLDSIPVTDMARNRAILERVATERCMLDADLFHFGPRRYGVLLLGTSQTIGHADGRFEVVAKSERIYRRIVENRPDASLFSTSSGDGLRIPSSIDQDAATAHRRTLPGLFRRLVLENYTSARCSSIVGKNAFIRGVRPNAICALRPSIQRMTRSRWRHRDCTRGFARPLIKSAGRSQTSPPKAGVKSWMESQLLSTSISDR